MKGGGVGANSREHMSVVFFFKYSFYAIVCLIYVGVFTQFSIITVWGMDGG
jgi:hypothetical protein